MWIELVAQSHRVQHGGVDVPLFEPFELSQPESCGGPGCALQVTGAQARRFLEPTGQTLRLLDEGGRVTRELEPGDVFDFGGEAPLAPPGLVFRVAASASHSCGWPDDVVAPAVVPDEAGLRVLGDLLLERGHAVGQRFISRVAGEDRAWLGAFPPLAVIGWRLGVVDGLRLSRVDAVWSTATALRRTAVTRGLRVLELSLPHADTTLRLLEALEAQGGLPWLEALTVEAPALGSEGRAGRGQRHRLHEAVDRLSRRLPHLDGRAKLSFRG